jgi:hypothetical protein
MPVDIGHFGRIDQCFLTYHGTLLCYSSRARTISAFSLSGRLLATLFHAEPFTAMTVSHSNYCPTASVMHPNPLYEQTNGFTHLHPQVSHNYLGARLSSAADADRGEGPGDSGNAGMGLIGENDVLLCGTVSGELWFIECSTLRVLHRRYVHVYEPITSIALSPGDHHIFVGTAMGSITVFSRNREYLRSRVIDKFAKAAIV